MRLSINTDIMDIEISYSHLMVYQYLNLYVLSHRLLKLTRFTYILNLPGVT